MGGLVVGIGDWFKPSGRVGAVVAEEGIDCGWHKGGALRIATSPTQAARVQAGVAGRRERGFTDEDVWEISLDELRGTDTVAVSAATRSRVVMSSAVTSCESSG